MHRLTVNLTPGHACDSHAGHCLNVPDIATALVVADINMMSGAAEICAGQKVLATVEKNGPGQAPFWRIAR